MQWILNLTINGRPVVLATFADSSWQARYKIKKDLKKAAKYFQNVPEPHVTVPAYTLYNQLVLERSNKCPVCVQEFPFGPDLENTLTASNHIEVMDKKGNLRAVNNLFQAVKYGWLRVIPQQTVWWSALDC